MNTSPYYREILDKGGKPVRAEEKKLSTLPSVGEVYYPLTLSFGLLTTTAHTWRGDKHDFQSVKTGNFFRTEDEAQSAISRVERALKNIRRTT